MRFKVPQNVEREDQIIWFITMRQLIVLIVGGGITYSLYINLAKVYFWEVWFLPVFILSALTLAIAFLKIKDLDFFDLVFLVLERILIPRTRVWTDGADAYYVSSKLIQASQNNKNKVKFTKKDEKAKTRLNEIAHILDHGFDEKKAEIDEEGVSDENLLTHSFGVDNKSDNKEVLVKKDNKSIQLDTKNKKNETQEIQKEKKSITEPQEEKEIKKESSQNEKTNIDEDGEIDLSSSPSGEINLNIKAS